MRKISREGQKRDWKRGTERNWEGIQQRSLNRTKPHRVGHEGEAIPFFHQREKCIANGSCVCYSYCL